MNLAKYMNDGITNIFRDALLSSRLDGNVKELRFLIRAVTAQKKAEKKRLQPKTGGVPVPPFLIASIATQCNLHCAGCYARANRTCMDAPSKAELSTERWGKIFREAESLGISFVLLAGGEPLERPDVLDEAAKISGLIYPVFTNGTLFKPGVLERFNLHRNLIPVISMEGGRRQTDFRRGQGVFETVRQTMEAMKHLHLLYGVSVTVTKDNLQTVTDNAYISDLKRAGCRVIFLVEYVPVDGNAELALDEKDRLILAARQKELKDRYPGMIFLSFPGDEKEMGGCLAAGRGFFHINAFGDAEPCPFSPYSDISLRNGSLQSALNSGLFRQIREQDFESVQHTGGCVLFSRESEVRKLLTGEKAM